MTDCDCPSTDPDASDNDLWDGVTCDCSLIPWNFSEDSGLLTYSSYITESDCECIVAEEDIVGGADDMDANPLEDLIAEAAVALGGTLSI